MYNILTGLLRMSDEFRDDGADIHINYQFDDSLSLLRDKYELNKFAARDLDFDSIIALLRWESSHIIHKGDYNNQGKTTAVELFDYAFDKGPEYGINCAALSAALRECMDAIGIRARTVSLFPCSPYDGDNHVVCEAWSSQYEKWIMVDPTYGLYLMDPNKTPLSILEIRERLANHDDLVFCEGYHYNGNHISEQEIKEYYAKDFYYFQLFQVQGFGTENIETNPVITVAPVGFDVQKRTIANIDYRVKLWGDSIPLKKWRNMVEHSPIIYKNEELLL